MAQVFVLLCVLPLAAFAQVTSQSQTALESSSLFGNNTILGNVYNYWSVLPNETYDLTRSVVMPVTAPKTIPMSGSRKTAIIEPSRSALVIIDMQNFFLHPELAPNATDGRAIVPATVNMINGFRGAGMKVLWTFWGLDGFDLLTMPPALKDGFTTNGSDLANETFGSGMGVLFDGTPVGAKLMRGAWNAQPWGVLNDLKNEGLAAGTDLYFNKNRLSGLWGAQTPLGLWLQENPITTLFFGGVNADQCVWSTFIDAYFKGYDVVYVEDISATTSPYYATQMVLYNGDRDGFLTNSTMVLPALNASA